MEASQQLLKHLSCLAFLACDSPLWLLIQKKVFVQFLQVFARLYLFVINVRFRKYFSASLERRIVTP
jgi:hypothetical protein